MIKDTNISLLDKRIVVVSRSLGIVITIVGWAAIISQLAQMSPFLPSYPGWDCDWGNIITIAIGAVFVFISSGTKMKFFLEKAITVNKEKTKRFLLLFPLNVAILMVILKLTLGQTKAYRRLLDEGGLIEYFTCISFFFASVFAYLIARHFWQNREKLLSNIYFFYSAFFFFIWGEEISWGQRFIGWIGEQIFGWQLPDFFEKYNTQGEWNIHNLIWIHKYSGRITIITALLALMAIGYGLWYVKSNSKAQVKTMYKYILPNWYGASFFIFTIILLALCEYCENYCTYSVYFGVIISADREVAELLLGLGFMIFSLTNYFRQGFADKLLINSQVSDYSLSGE